MPSHRADRLAVADQGSRSTNSDWADNWRSFALLWGLPALAMIMAGHLAPFGRTIIWTTSLAWMGIACLVNARRCQRTHCRFTGPFFLLMALAVLAYASGLLPLGVNGWHILGIATLAGTISIWWASERVWGKHLP